MEDPGKSSPCRGRLISVPLPRILSPAIPKLGARVSNVPEDLLYSEEHEFVRKIEDDIIEIGITDYAQGELGDIVFVSLPKVGEEFDQGQMFGTIEAVKAVSELFCPASGEVVEVNGSIEADPAMVNNDPYGEGWMVRFKLGAPDELDTLLNAEAYGQHIGE
ncbi:MAG: glycine cleavage system protein GcvH [Gemmatimonadales bacterium]|nr:glycine cleavage system protein GcvH [Gemmatimonadales bacterium]